MTRTLDAEAATGVLASDPVFAGIVAEVGPVDLRPPKRSYLAGLVRAIVFQQLAGAAAAAIHGRVVDEALDGEVTAEAILAVDDEALADAGLSGAKVASLNDLASRAAADELGLDEIGELDDEGVRRRLTQVRGVGPWTADMFLIFELRRADVWPTGDLGVRKGWGLLHGADEPPSAGELEGAADGYRPWRTAVAWYCWRAAETTTPGG